MSTYEQTDGEKALCEQVENDACKVVASAVSLAIHAAYVRGAFETSVKHLKMNAVPR